MVNQKKYNKIPFRMPLEIGQTGCLRKRDREKRTGKMINHAFCMSYCKDGKIIPILHPLLEDDNR